MSQGSQDELKVMAASLAQHVSTLTDWLAASDRQRREVERHQREIAAELGLAEIPSRWDALRDFLRAALACIDDDAEVAAKRGRGALSEAEVWVKLAKKRKQAQRAKQPKRTRRTRRPGRARDEGES